MPHSPLGGQDTWGSPVESRNRVRLGRSFAFDCLRPWPIQAPFCLLLISWL